MVQLLEPIAVGLEVDVHLAGGQVLDGFQVWHTEYYTDHFGEYQRRVGATDIYRKYLLPAALAAWLPVGPKALAGAFEREARVLENTEAVSLEAGVMRVLTKAE